MDVHAWVDVAGYVLLAAVTIVAVILGALISRVTSQHQDVESALQEFRHDISKIKGWIAGKFDIQL